MSELREKIDEVVTKFAADLIDWCEARGKMGCGDEPLSDDVTDAIVALLSGPVMPATPSEAVLSVMVAKYKSEGLCVYGSIRDMLAKEQGR